MRVDERLDLVVHDVWEALPAQLRDEFVTRRAAATGSGWGTNPRQKADSRRRKPIAADLEL